MDVARNANAESMQVPLETHVASTQGVTVFGGVG